MFADIATIMILQEQIKEYPKDPDSLILYVWNSQDE